MVTAERPTLTLDNLNITDTSLYVDYGYPWEAWDILRREAPVYWYLAAQLRAVLGDHQARRHPLHLFPSRAVLEHANPAHERHRVDRHR